jgi:hypothetical protein
LKEKLMRKSSVIAVIVVVIVLAACAVLVVSLYKKDHSKHGSGGTSPAPGGQVTAPADRGGAGEEVPGSLPEIPTGKGIISAVTMDSATTTPGDLVTATGTLTMPEGETGDVAISVSWVDPATSSVYARGVTTLTGVKPGEQRTWEVTADLPASAEGASTVLGAVIVGS